MICQILFDLWTQWIRCKNRISSRKVQLPLQYSMLSGWLMSENSLFYFQIGFGSIFLSARKAYIEIYRKDTGFGTFLMCLRSPWRSSWIDFWLVPLVMVLLLRWLGSKHRTEALNNKRGARGVPASSQRCPDWSLSQQTKHVVIQNNARK